MLTVILLFTLCIATQPVPCKYERLPLVDVSVIACQVAAPRIIAEWVNDHDEEGAALADWQCVDPNKEGENL